MHIAVFFSDVPKAGKARYFIHITIINLTMSQLGTFSEFRTLLTGAYYLFNYNYTE